MLMTPSNACQSRRFANHKSSRCAFTLIELILVVLIVSVMAAVAAPKYAESLASFRIQGVAQRIAADIRQARRYAQQNSSTQWIIFNVTTNSYVLTDINNVDRPSQTYQLSLANPEYECELVSADFNSTAILTFDIFGRPLNTGTIVVRCGNLTQTLTIDELGQVAVL
jgi:prepilin-type N-terminal cleavage/methylation domain-containing protein